MSRSFYFLLGLLIFTTAALAKDELFLYDGPFDLQIHEVRSIAPQTRVGLGKSLSLYRVEATNTHIRYVLYCTGAAPEAGQIYKAREDFVSANYSTLHVWPTDRADVPIPNMPKGNKTLFRVVILQNVNYSKHPDLACDIYKRDPLN